MVDLQALRRRTVEISYGFHHGHLASALSALPIIADIYDHMSADDVFILSKGHACAAWYAVLEHHGYAPDVTKQHPDRCPQNGIVCTTGSLGHGLPIGVGIALGKVLANEKGTVRVLMGDGECAEGTTWECVLLIDRLRLENIEIHVDVNGYQALGRTVFHAVEMLVGCATTWMPVCEFVTIYRTVKGHGLTLFADHPDWHVHYLTKDEYEAAMKELQDEPSGVEKRP